MDFAKFIRAGDFSLPLSMGEVHVRSLTSTWTHELQALARTEISDTDLVCAALGLAGRSFPRPPKQGWNEDDDPSSGNEIAAAASSQDLEAVAEKLIAKNPYLPRGAGEDEERVPPKEPDETHASFFRRALIWRQDKTRQLFEGLISNSTRQAVEDLAFDSDIMSRQFEDSRAVMRAAVAIPRAEERIEDIELVITERLDVVQGHLSKLVSTGLRLASDFAESSHSTTRFNMFALAIAAVSLVASVIISGWALKKSYEDSSDSERKMDAAVSGIKTELKAAGDELRGLRAEVKAQAQRPAPRAKASAKTTPP